MNEIADSGTPETIELLVAPIPPDTVATVKAEVVPEIQRILEESGNLKLWEDGEIKVEIEKTLSVEEQAVIVVVQLLSAAALEVFKLVLTEWKKKFEVKKRKSRKKKKGKSKKAKK